LYITLEYLLNLTRFANEKSLDTDMRIGFVHRVLDDPYEFQSAAPGKNG